MKHLRMAAYGIRLSARPLSRNGIFFPSILTLTTNDWEGSRCIAYVAGFHDTTKPSKLLVSGSCTLEVDSIYVRAMGHNKCRIRHGVHLR